MTSPTPAANAGRPQELSLWLGLATLTCAGAVLVTCAIGLVSLADLSRITTAALEKQLNLLDDAAGFQSLLYQRGFVSHYILTGDESVLKELNVRRDEFTEWLSHAEESASSPEERELLVRLDRQYQRYVDVRLEALSHHHEGSPEQTKAALRRGVDVAAELRELCQEFEKLARSEALATLASARQKQGFLLKLLVGSSILAVLGSLASGFLLARRIGRPLQELTLRVESAAQKRRLVLQSPLTLQHLGLKVDELLRQLEESDETLSRQRHRLVQSEKLSAIGELAAKLAHEILNPLTGVKAASQLLLLQCGMGKTPADLEHTVTAINHEVTRVDGLIRRLLRYARPLEPKRESTSVSLLLERARDAVAPELERRGQRLELDQAPDLPNLFIDLLLMTQVLANLLLNSAQASKEGATIWLRARRKGGAENDRIELTVEDEGAGIDAQHLSSLFQPFFTTKPEGHGLGLAVSHNIVEEHEGQLSARNRDNGPGAIFEVAIPVLG